MTHFACMDIDSGNLLLAIQGFLTRMLEETDIDAILVPKRKEAGCTIMPVLVTDPEQMAGADPLSPCFALNAARQVARLTRKASGKKIAAVLRPCEIRALVELSKLKQADLTRVLLISVDCLGGFSNKQWNQACASEDKEAASLDPASFITRQMDTMDAPVTTACASASIRSHLWQISAWAFSAWISSLNCSLKAVLNKDSRSWIPCPWLPVPNLWTGRTGSPPSLKNAGKHEQRSFKRLGEDRQPG